MSIIQLIERKCYGLIEDEAATLPLCQQDHQFSVEIKGPLRRINSSWYWYLLSCDIFGYFLRSNNPTSKSNSDVEKR